MKLALLLPSNIWFCPYIKIYTNILKQYEVNYDVISWNRDGTENSSGLTFNEIANHTTILSKLIQYLRYVRHVKNILKRNNYDKIIVFGPQLGIFLQKYLESNYKNKYIFDYRDLSIDQLLVFKKRFSNLLNNSFANIISSPGFKNYLPDKFSYIISHNLNIDLAKKSVAKKYNDFNKKEPLTILTIGGIRDYISNIKIVDALANKSNFIVRFVGKGNAVSDISNYIKLKNIKNVELEGYYDKKDEGRIIEKSSFLNIFYPEKISHSSALSNRFYNGLIYRKPLIVTKNSIQGDLVEQYNLGLSLENCDKLELQIYSFLNENNFSDFDARCNQLLIRFIDDYEIFQIKVIDFIYNE